MQQVQHVGSSRAVMVDMQQAQHVGSSLAVKFEVRPMVNRDRRLCKEPDVGQVVNSGLAFHGPELTPAHTSEAEEY